MDGTTDEEYRDEMVLIKQAWNNGASLRLTALMLQDLSLRVFGDWGWGQPKWFFYRAAVEGYRSNPSFAREFRRLRRGLEYADRDKYILRSMYYGGWRAFALREPSPIVIQRYTGYIFEPNKGYSAPSA